MKEPTPRPQLFNIFLVAVSGSLRGESARDLPYIHDELKSLLDGKPLSVCYLYGEKLSENYLPRQVHIQVQLVDDDEIARLQKWCAAAKLVGLIKEYTQIALLS